MIGYLGPEGSYTFSAALSFNTIEDLIPHNNIGRLFYALENHEVEGIIVPFENMKQGISFDVLGRVRKGHYHISREIVLEIILSVVSKEPNSENIEQIFATTHSINECYNNLKKEFGKYQRFEVKTDKMALEKLNEETKVKRGSVLSNFEELGSYNVVVSNIRDTKENTNKYAYITRSLQVNGVHNKTLIACSPKFNRTGSLYDIIHEFIIRGVNITKILSSPQKTSDDNIIIYIEVDGNIEDKLITEALNIVKLKSRFISILGSYFSK
ncbi:Prephenate dehydratase [Candidatus Izimaplasma bacterium HR1]|jgi:prephenate dehydratase|uniref:prephenate dehydratase n=1 Tax=Candidatus Izimoplasma sp. HR1 TaxID=1541959 RepID=UPI0004F7EAFD|nr:Prephenate dehydratase [Candidatus Izimaplasma bacterium HR1]